MTRLLDRLLLRSATANESGEPLTMERAERNLQEALRALDDRACAVGYTAQQCTPEQQGAERRQVMLLEQARAMAGRTIAEEQHHYVIAYRAQINEITAKQTQADERAKELLLENLDDEQRQEFLRFRHFRVKSTLYRGADYQIEFGRQGNIYFHQADGNVKQLCAVPNEFVPEYDAMLVQKIMIECDEAGFLAVANDLTARVEGPYVRFGTPRGIQGHGGGGGALGSGMFAALQLVTVLVAVVALVATL